MHEYSLVEAMLDQVDTIRLAQRADRVCSIEIGIGEFSGVEPDLFADAFELLRQDGCAGRDTGPAESAGGILEKSKPKSDQMTAAPAASGSSGVSPPSRFAVSHGRAAWKSTRLQIHSIPLEARCSQCHQVFRVEKFHFQCPQCHSPELTILRGEDLILESVTLEGDHSQGTIEHDCQS